MKEIFFSPILEDNQIARLAQNVEQGQSPCSVFGVSDSQKVHLASAVSHSRPILYITWSQERAERISEDLEVYLEREAVLLPAREGLPGVRDSGSQSSMMRAQALSRLVNGADILVAGIDALLYNLMPPQAWSRAFIKLDYSTRISPANLRLRCLKMGYQEEDMVCEQGQISVRGGIADVFPVGWDNPVRIEFFDDEIDSLRLLDPNSQRSVQRLEEVTLTPAGELYIENPQKGGDFLNAQLSSFKRKASRSNPEGGTEAENIFQPIIDSLASGAPLYESDLFPYFYSEYTPITEFLGENVLVIMDEPRRIRERADSAALEYSEIFKEQLAKGRVLPMHAQYLRPYEQLLVKLKEKTLLSMQSITASCSDISPQAVFTLAARSMQSFQNNPSLLAKELIGLRHNKFKVLICAGGENKARRLVSELEGLNVYAQYTSDFSLVPQPGEIFILPCRISRGFEYTQARMCFISDGDIFSASAPRRQVRRIKHKKGADIGDIMELAIGDYVVHDNHGIGIYKGITKIRTDGVYRDYITIAYQGADKLYVPAEQLKLVQKYMGGEDAAPKINKLGSKEWAGAKARAKKAIRDMTDELISLYSKRESAKGHAFAPDTPFQRNFEDDFPFNETSDQLRAIDEIKHDMESERVMDRLLCGDVGYGKTEVAMRAAFKSVMDGKQVAFLAPTTILAQQHYNTMAARMLPYGIRLDMLSRFRSAKERKQVLADLKEGKIDIIAGTHALLSKDVQFKSLGLLVVDEEQRFGVAHKEKIKQLKNNIDVLTLTATPIPRTLHMSLTGVRDMSIIDTPPDERYPVQTYVAEYSRIMIRDAIMRELGRGGQIYFVYNRIQGIESFAEGLKELVPEARIGIGHGQMPEGELEKTVMDFYDGAFDILLCTAIIENGVDIPRANTIIVYDADKFGLSQLYQLKGRVGRSNRIAYAYFTFRSGSVLTEVAEKRLNALREFSEMGSGFKIAMRDLEIRGAGNMLGGEQHGHIAQIGYELYCRLIKEAVNEGMEPGEKHIETVVEIKTDAYIDSEYIRSEPQKVTAYKRIAEIEDSSDKEDILEELIDRYGDPPKSTLNLINIAYMKALASKGGISHITQRPDAIILRLDTSASVDLSKLTRALDILKGRATLSAGDKLAIRYPLMGITLDYALEQIIKFLEYALS